MTRESILKIADWVLPPNWFRLLTWYKPAAVLRYWSHRSVFRANAEIKDRHAGERCFVLCNGPSVKEQDIRGLKNEIVFTVSNGYLHPDFKEISPRYHCVPQVSYSTLPPEGTVRWFGEMDRQLENAELFLDAQEYSLVQNHGLFSGRKIRFVCMGKNYFRDSGASPKLTGILPRVQTVPIMVLMIAMEMGFKEIYLIGVDHDWFAKREYQYFFARGKMGWKDQGVHQDGKLTSTLWDDIPTVKRVWEQYRALKRIAEKRGVKIFNATRGGMLDEFPRVELATALKEKSK